MYPYYYDDYWVFEDSIDDVYWGSERPPSPYQFMLRRPKLIACYWDAVSTWVSSSEVFLLINEFSPWILGAKIC